MSAVWH